jgi:hypothetical protein
MPKESAAPMVRIDSPAIRFFLPDIFNIISPSSATGAVSIIHQPRNKWVADRSRPAATRWFVSPARLGVQGKGGLKSSNFYQRTP